MLIDQDVSDLEKMLRVKFSLIVSSIISPESSYAALHRSTPEVSQERLTNSTFLAVLSGEQIKDFLNKAKAAKRANSLTACTVVVPFGNSTDLTLFKGWHVLKEFPSQHGVWEEYGDQVLNHRSPTGIRIYHQPAIPPQTLFAIPNQSGLRMQFQGTAARVPCRILTDSGATHCYISKGFLERNGITYVPQQGREVKLADAKLTTPVLGTCRLSLCIQKHRSRVHFHVIDLFDTFDVVLGDDWLMEQKAVMDWQTKALTVRRGKKVVLR